MSGALETFDRDAVFDILRGAAALTDNALVGAIARVCALTPRADLSVAFNHKQIASKRWLLDELHAARCGAFGRVVVAGGWYGLLSAMLLGDPRFQIGEALSVDIDPACAEVAETLNAVHVKAGRFAAVTADMRALDLGPAGADLLVNTSCEHVENLDAWLARAPAGALLALQSNDYRREPDHVACVDSLEAFERQAGLGEIRFRGELSTKNYTRFMLIGRRPSR